MATLQEILREECGFEIRYGPAAAAYRRSTNYNELCYAAGEHLCFHAHAIMRTLRLPKRGTLALAIARKLSRNQWIHYWKLHNEAYSTCAIISLDSVRQFSKQINRSQELLEFVDSIYIMSCLYLEEVLRLNCEEKNMFREQATEALVQHGLSSGQAQHDPLSMLIKIDGVELRKIDKAQFIRQAICQRGKLEPHVLVDEYDRLNRRSRSA